MQFRTRVVPRYPARENSVFLDAGFRPFFLGAGIFAVLSMILWILVLTGLISLPVSQPSTNWHAHEMLFGYASAALAGFLLTAIASWTGRPPVSGRLLLNLFMLWIAGRVMMTFGSGLAPVTSALIDGVFLPVLLVVVSREIILGKSWRNLPVCAAVALLAAANFTAHLEVFLDDIPHGIGVRLGLSVYVCLIVLIGGRLVPNFTNNWFRTMSAPYRARPSSLFDLTIILLTVAALGSWLVSPESRTTGLLLANAAIGNALRFIRWNGYNAGAEPLVWILHVGYAWVPLGLLFLGVSQLDSSVPVSAGIHALTAGAIGTMTVAVMTRATLGHSGQALQADGATFCIYALLVFAAGARVAAAFPIEHQTEMLYLSGMQWCGGFLLFCIRYGVIILGGHWIKPCES